MGNKSMRFLSSALSHRKATIPRLGNWTNPVIVLSETRSKRQLKPRTGHIPIDALPKWLAALDGYVLVREMSD